MRPVYAKALRVATPVDETISILFKMSVGVAKTPMDKKNNAITLT